MIVAEMTDPRTNEPRAIHRTFLNPDDSNQKKPDGKNHRKILGRPASSGYPRMKVVLAAMFIVHHATLLHPAGATDSARHHFIPGSVRHRASNHPGR
jgi:hypothetical protein